MIRPVRGVAAVAAIGLAFFTHSAPRLAAQPRHQDASVLHADRRVERDVVRGEVHTYTLVLDEGEYAHVVVEQLGVDIVAQVRPREKFEEAEGLEQVNEGATADFDDDLRNTGQEDVEIVTDVPATFTIEVKAAEGVLPAHDGGRYAISLAGRRAANGADWANQESRQLRTRASRLETEGRFDAARSLLERALTLTEGARGAGDLQTAAVAAQLASVYRRLPDDEKSEALYERALSILDASVGPDHPAAAVVRAGLARFYQSTGQRAKSEVRLQLALDAIETTLGTENRWFVSGQLTLANLQHAAGDYVQEEVILRRGMATMERLENTDSLLYASLLNNLGEVYRLKEDYARAEDFFRQALTIGARVLGEDSYFNTGALQRLGIIARERRQFAEAEAYYARALSIRERVVGPDHPEVAQLLNNLATIYRSEGQFEKSLDIHLRALHIWEHAAGPYQQSTLLSAGNIARAYAASGDTANAIAYQRRSDAILEKQLTLNLAIGSERQKLLFVNSTAERTDRTISLNLLEAPGNPDAASLAALVIQQRKGRVLDAMAGTFAAVRQRVAGVRDRDLLHQLKTTTAQLAQLALRASDPSNLTQRETELGNLEAQKERLEAQLSEHSAEIRAQLQPVTLEAVQAAIPGDAALLEFAIFRPFDPRADRTTEAYGPARYAVYVMRRWNTPRAFDLGPVSAINEAIAALRRALADPARPDVKERARLLDSLVMQPLRPAFDGASRLLISPDGELNLVPFEALVDERGRYLIERYAMSYLTSGRDLLRMQVARPNAGRPAVFANPLFGEPSPVVSRQSPVANHQSSVDSRQSTVVSLRSAIASVTSGPELSAMYFAPLAATAEEAQAIKALFPESALFTGERATKAELQKVEAPRMLHIASHGFFLTDARVQGVNPLVRSGLAFAGANLSPATRESGILTALEASSLNLWGTRLVTLSACDTGVGEVRNGEGVYGLRRAFVLAGAESLVMSLWPVNDAIARETMVAYYRGLRAGLGRGDALRQSKLTMLRRNVRQHPYYWAGFIQSGEWASLNASR